MNNDGNQIINDKDSKYYWIYDNNYEYLPGKHIVNYKRK